MSLFRGSGRLEQKLAQNNDPMKQKKLWVKSFYCAAVLAALGLFFLLAMGSQFTVFACVLLGCAAFVFVDGLVTKNTAALTRTVPHCPEELTAAVEAAGYKVTRIE